MSGVECVSKIKSIISIIFYAIYRTECFQLTHFFCLIVRICVLILLSSSNRKYDMMTSSNENIFRVTGPLYGEFTGPGEFPAQRPVARGFDVFFNMRLNKRLSKQPRGWRFETPSSPLWRHCNVFYAIYRTGCFQLTHFFSLIVRICLLILLSSLNRKYEPLAIVWG